MLFYHTAKGGDMPFYASSTELSHAIKLKFENLQSLERTWIMNRQRMDIMRKFGANIETDIHLISEELKKLVTESRKRNANVKPSDFFQIVKPKNNSVNNTSASVSHDYIPLSPNISQFSNNFKYPLHKYIIADVPRYFYVKNGQVFKSLVDLIDGLEVMDKRTFDYHVNDFKNDFSNWIKGVFGDLRLADAIRHITDREQLWHFLKNNTY
jgi:hypothetical protein